MQVIGINIIKDLVNNVTRGLNIRFKNIPCFFAGKFYSLTKHEESKNHKVLQFNTVK